MKHLKLQPSPLDPDAFKPFGDVIEAKAPKGYSINQGTATRFDDLAKIDVSTLGGRPLVNIFRGQPRKYPLEIKSLERHPLGSQTFIPLDKNPYLVVVALAKTTPKPDDLCAFLAAGDQGVNYRKGVWHHPLLTIKKPTDFLVIDRAGAGNNLDEIKISTNSLMITIEHTDIA